MGNQVVEFGCGNGGLGVMASHGSVPWVDASGKCCRVLVFSAGDNLGKSLQYLNRCHKVGYGVWSVVHRDDFLFYLYSRFFNIRLPMMNKRHVFHSRVDRRQCRKSTHFEFRTRRIGIPEGLLCEHYRFANSIDRSISQCTGATGFEVTYAAEGKGMLALRRGSPCKRTYQKRIHRRKSA